MDARLAARLAEALATASAGAEGEGGDAGDATTGPAGFDEGKYKKALEAARKRLFDSVPVIKCKVCVNLCVLCPAVC
jgi:hypothetical protein